MSTNIPVPKEPGSRKQFSAEFKKMAVAKLASSTNISALAAELGVRRNRLYKWRDALQAAGPNGTLKSPGRPSGSKVSELVRMQREVARLELENAILKKAQAYFTK